MKSASEKRQASLLPLGNHEVAEHLDEIARLLQAQGANPFRATAYQTAAQTVRSLDRPLNEILDAKGAPGLTLLPGIGDSLANAIERLVRTGRLPLLTRLRGDAAPQRIFTTVADIGPELARRIHDELGIETLAELEIAANDGRLATVPGMGPKRVRAVRESLAGRFRERRRRRATAPNEPTDEPSVAELLEIDRRYRRLAENDRLPRVAPRRLNPTGEAWLPVMHAEFEDRHYTALYSNTVRAHEFGTLRDWVVIYRDDEGQGQWTVITGGFGALRGRRIVRGREAECADHYNRQQPGERTTAD